MPTRRFHGKTTTGCFACKARHVKCDEARPECKNCRRRKEECRFPGGDASSTTPPGNSSNGSSFAAPAVPSSHSFDGLDLALMHHYSTVTSLHLFPSDGGAHVWQGIVPAKAQLPSGVILQHGMLALSALELACHYTASGDITQATMYRARGLQHQQAGIMLFRVQLASEDSADGNAAFIFSLMLIILAFSSAHSATTKPSLDDILDVFALMRGPKALWQMHNDPTNGQLIETMSPERNKPSPFVPEQETELSRALGSLQLDEICSAAVGILIAAWTRFDVERQDVRGIALLPAVCSDEFREQIRQRKPDAMVVLVNYANLVSRFRARWWVGPWDDFILEAIEGASPGAVERALGRNNDVKSEMSAT
ncbi:unnamed protein product [Zymoseptoria tritici ST99CH_1A5]|uniref:Zn(2)-C6 fungal-type domain-containing protein n=2 Tax=Zymoseptoria tritici TaxID=1047171 RepID=A0A2H1GAZ4_ZYMTR|nr:unnamed protein product [Zymoseptoria tritici ST99CH_1E4]SMY23448.1 unnamed protein product [Zymoseptoria tritici ST99CH_1A5]